MPDVIIIAAMVFATNAVWDKVINPYLDNKRPEAAFVMPTDIPDAKGTESNQLQ